jgi:hypothetical protein
MSPLGGRILLVTKIGGELITRYSLRVYFTLLLLYLTLPLLLAALSTTEPNQYPRSSR